MKILSSLFAAALLLPLCGQELMPDGSFENSAVGKAPKGWFVGRAQGAQSVVEVVGGGLGTEGKNVLKIISTSPVKAHRFSHITTSLPLVPGERYRLQYNARGKNVGGYQWSFGKSWKERFRATTVSEKFEPFSYDFIAKPEEFENGKYKIQILIEDIADELWIDEISIHSLAPQVIPASAFLAEKIWPVQDLPGGGGIAFNAVDGNYTGDAKAARLSGNFAMAFEKDGLVVTAKIKDPVIRVRQHGAMWTGDSIQLRIDRTGKRGDSAELSDLEIGFAPDQERVNTWCWQFDRALKEEECVVEGGLTNDGYQFRALLKWKLLDTIETNPDRLFSFNFIVNNDDGTDRRVWFLAPGIHTPSKSSVENLLAWHQTGELQMRVVPDEPAFWKNASGRVFLTGLESADSQTATLVLRDGKGQSIRSTETLPVLKKGDICRLIYHLDAGALDNGSVTLELILADGRKMTGELLKRNVGVELKAGTEAARKEYQELSTKRDAVGEDWKKSNYLNTGFYLIDRHLGFLERDLNRNYASKEEEEYYQRICDVELTGVREALQRMRTLLAQGEKGKAGFAAWRYISSPAKCHNGFFTATAASESGSETRPLFFAGFGHFQDLVRDIPVMNRIGANLIQIEIGPSRFFKAPSPGQGDLENIDLDRFRNYIEKAMQSAQQENVKISLLISPHYPFSHFVNKDRANTHDTNGRYAFYHRGNRPMLEAYVKGLFAELVKSPYKDTIQSIVLSNEPNMKTMTMSTCFLKPEFETYLQERFGSLEKYNSLTGKNYSSIDDLLAAGEGDPVARYAFHSFKREFFAEWHKWFGDLVRAAWPGMPTSSKVMALHNYLPSTYGDAIDLELFGEITEINGNDNFSYYDSARWGSNWPRLTMSCDVQYTQRKNAIANTENHVIPDGTKGAVIPQHIYTSTMQQFLHGTGSIVTWVWVDLDWAAEQKAPIDLKGGVFRRPSAILAQSEALLDANRIAADLIAFNEAPEQVGILYSPTNIIYNINEVSAPTEELYTLLNFGGHKVGFLSERKVAAGDFRDYKILFLPSVLNLDRKASERLADFVRQGGTIYTWKGAPVRDEFNRPLTPGFQYTTLPENLTETEFFFALEKVLASVPRKAPAKVLHHAGNIGVITREATANSTTWLNLTNYNREARTVELPFSATELISGRELQGKVELAPLEVMFLKLK